LKLALLDQLLYVEAVLVLDRRYNANLVVFVEAGGVATKYNILQFGVLIKLFADLITHQPSSDRFLVVGRGYRIGLELHNFLFPCSVAFLYEIVAKAHRLELFFDFGKLRMLNKTYVVQRALRRKLDLPICLRQNRHQWQHLLRCCRLRWRL
jgi:hypothetical protein